MVSLELTVSDTHPYAVEQKEAEILMDVALKPALYEINGSDGYYRVDLHLGNIPDANWNGTITLSRWKLTIQEDRIMLAVSTTHPPYEGLLKKFIEHTFERYRTLERDYLKTVEHINIMKEAGRF